MRDGKLMRRLGVWALLATLPAASAQAATIKVSTLQPKTSSTGQALTTWAKTVATRTGGAVSLEVHFNGSDGDEGAMVEKLKGGTEIDAVLVSTVGLSKIWRPILALQAPGLFTSWSQVDAARTSMQPEIDAGFASAGMVSLGSVDFGWARMLWKGAEVRGPTDLQGRNPFMWSDDMIAAVFYRTIDGVTPKPMSIDALALALRANSVDVVFSSCVVATDRQWVSWMENFAGNLSTSVEIGALVIKRTTLDSLTPEQRKVVVDSAAATTRSLNAAARKRDADCLATLPKSLAHSTTLTPEQIAEWNALFTKTREALKQGVFDPALLTKLEGFGK